jgi:hypothetical protein
LPQYFFDTSAIVKYYHSEIGTPTVTRIFAERDRRVRISSLGFLEIQSAFAMKVRSRALSREASGMLRSRLLLDVAASDIEIYKITDNHFATAQRLIGEHSFSARLRTLDALQLAVAIDLTQQSLLDHFVVADTSLAAVAMAEQLNVINPEGF